MSFEFVPGVIQSPPDHRDYIYAQLIDTTQELPKSFFWDKTPVRNQGSFGTCVGFACSATKDKQEAKNYPSRGIRTSPLFIYTECKKRDGIPNEEGTYIRVAMKVLKDVGVCKERTFPYEKIQRPLPDPPSYAYDEAKQFIIGPHYARVQTVEEIKNAIATQGPVVAGVLVCDSFINSSDGVIPVPGSKGPDRILGGHAICIDGFDDAIKMYRFQNSWGDSWGDKGYGWIPYELVNWRLDIGVPFLLEAWSSVDVLLPPPEVKKIEMWLDNPVVLVDGEEVILDQPPIVKSGRTLVPVRFLAEVLGWAVEWDGVQRKVTLTNPKGVAA